MKQLYAIQTKTLDTRFGLNYLGIVLSEDGEQLTAHESSSENWLKHDLGVMEYMDSPPFKHDIFDKKYGKGNWNIQWVEELPKEVREKIK